MTHSTTIHPHLLSKSHCALSVARLFRTSFTSGHRSRCNSLPRATISRLGIIPDPALQYELIGFDGSLSTTQAVDLEMIFLNKIFRGRYLLTDDETGILGRDVLASLMVLLNGPGQEWTQYNLPTT